MREGSPNLALVMLGVYATFALFELRGRSVWEPKMREGSPNLALVMLWIYRASALFELRGRSV